MSTIQEEKKRITDNIADAYASLKAKGVTMPQEQNSNNLTSTIDSINVADVTYDSSTGILTIKPQ